MIFERAVVDVLEVTGRFNYRRFELDTGDSLDRELFDSSESDAASETYEQNIVSMLANQQWKRPDQYLSRHISGGRRFGLAVDFQDPSSALLLYGHGSGNAFLIEDRFTLSAPEKLKQLLPGLISQGRGIAIH